jgi:threonine dehydrogenase-like Zn-dependent dehydrogenase
MDKLKDGSFDPSFLITHRISLQDVPMMYEKLFNQQDGCMKVMITP